MIKAAEVFAIRIMCSFGKGGGWEFYSVKVNGVEIKKGRLSPSNPDEEILKHILHTIQMSTLAYLEYLGYEVICYGQHSNDLLAMIAGYNGSDQIPTIEKAIASQKETTRSFNPKKNKL